MSPSGVTPNGLKGLCLVPSYPAQGPQPQLGFPSGRAEERFAQCALRSKCDQHLYIKKGDLINVFARRAL